MKVKVKKKVATNKNRRQLVVATHNKLECDGESLDFAVSFRKKHKLSG